MIVYRHACDEYVNLIGCWVTTDLPNLTATGHFYRRKVIAGHMQFCQNQAPINCKFISILAISININQLSELLNFVFPGEANWKSPWENWPHKKARNSSKLCSYSSNFANSLPIASFRNNLNENSAICAIPTWKNPAYANACIYVNSFCSSATTVGYSRQSKSTKN